MRVLYLSSLVVILDQVTKYLVKGISIPFLGITLNGMPYGISKPVLGNFLKITFIENRGIAFGWDVGPIVLRIVVTIIACLVIVYYIYKYRKTRLSFRISLAFVFAGALGNLIDRVFYGLIYNYSSLFYGRVVDFIQFDFWNFTLFGKTYTSWPVMNVADISVTVGFLVLLFSHKKIFQPHEEKSVSPELNSNLDSASGNDINQSEIRAL
ncbi:MAG: signal peptidase II [Ignavibacteria bacterium]